MSAIQTLREHLSSLNDNIKIFIFGENNSRLDDLIDRFYNIRQEKRTKIIFYSVISVTVVFLLLIYFYFYGLFALQSDLAGATQSMVKLQGVKASYNTVQTDFLKISEQISGANDPRTVLPAIENQIKAMNLNVTGFPTQGLPVVDLPSTSFVASQFQKARIEFKISSISLKKMVEFINKIHALPNKVKLTKLEIMQTFGNKLYFDVNLALELYVPNQKAKEP